MLGSEIGLQATLLLSPYAFVLLIKPACSFRAIPRGGSSQSCSALRLRLRRGSSTPSCSCRTVPVPWWRRGGATGSSRSWRPYKTVRLTPHSRLHGSLRRVAFGSLGAQAPPCNARACLNLPVFTRNEGRFLSKRVKGCLLFSEKDYIFIDNRTPRTSH